MPCAASEASRYLDQHVAAWSPMLAEVIRNRLVEPHLGVPMMLRPPVWGTRRCILVGDAAHAIAPTLSQGGSLAMEDGYALAAILQADISVEDVAARFAAVRSSAVDWALKIATAQVNSHRRGVALQEAPSERDFSIRYMQRMYSPLIEQSKKLKQLA